MTPSDEQLHAEEVQGGAENFPDEPPSAHARGGGAWRDRPQAKESEVGFA